MKARRRSTTTTTTTTTTHDETLGLSMELNDDILVQTTSLQTVARIKQVKCFMLHKVP